MPETFTLPPNSHLMPCHNIHGKVIALALVDRDKLEVLNSWRWSYTPAGQVVRVATIGHGNKRRRVTLNMAREVLGLAPTGGPTVRHRTHRRMHDGLPLVDNRLANLTLSQRYVLDAVSAAGEPLERLVTSHLVADAMAKAVAA